MLGKRGGLSIAFGTDGQNRLPRLDLYSPYLMIVLAIAGTG